MRRIRIIKNFTQSILYGRRSKGRPAVYVFIINVS